MDIVKKIHPLKATYLSLSLKHKFGIVITLISLTTMTVPHKTFASQYIVPKTGPMYFVMGNKITYLDNLNLQLSKLNEEQVMSEEITRQLMLGKKVKSYLQQQGSPLAEYATTLIQLNNWKKIIALSNAESGMCKHYPKAKSNCWGIGGSNLWYMGSTLGDGVMAMNHFLNVYPKRSSIKYSDMSFKQMNGLYKQPPAKHWVDNNQAVYNDLVEIERSL